MSPVSVAQRVPSWGLCGSQAGRQLGCGVTLVWALSHGSGQASGAGRLPPGVLSPQRWEPLCSQDSGWRPQGQDSHGHRERVRKTNVMVFCDLISETTANWFFSVLFSRKVTRWSPKTRQRGHMEV